MSELGQAQVGAEKLVVYLNDRVVYASLGMRLGAEVPIVPHFGVRAFGELLGPLTPMRIANVVRGTLWQSSPVVGSVGAGVYF